jgi:hypothetical protein
MTFMVNKSYLPSHFLLFHPFSMNKVPSPFLFCPHRPLLFWCCVIYSSPLSLKYCSLLFPLIPIFLPINSFLPTMFRGRWCEQ